MPNHSPNTTELVPLYPFLYEETVRRALFEDFGGRGDVTTDAVVAPDDRATARIVARAPGRIAGIEVAGFAFRCLDSGLKYGARVRDGKDAAAGETLAVVQGAARPILSAERTALNFLAGLSGIATATRDIAALIAAYSARVVCTRKTTPGLRVLEKYAVRAGGGSNHRFGLDDALLIKDNHIVVAGGVSEAIQRARHHAGHMAKIEVEVDTLEQLETALREEIDAVLLDNMPVPVLAEAVRMVNKRVITEASGGISAQTAEAVAATGVDFISIGWITHSAPALDLSLDFAFEL
ncbi:MAG TPA: carboxylating nicotinate-nucleotide diphosphorylase [Acidobacteriota bacterium]|nr:carboxylating nicotinate-nucleotide diphosphorylase [Acidobacteriota bacterium]